MVIVLSWFSFLCSCGCFAQVEAIRRGMASVVPCHLLRLFSWDELEVLVCGTTDVDIDLLEACTEYSLCNRHDPHITAFWDVLRSFSAKEQSLFLRCDVDELRIFCRYCALGAFD